MESLTTPQIIILVFGSSGIIAGFISLLAFIANRMDKAKEKKEAERRTHLSESSEIARISLDERRFTKETFIAIIVELRAEITNLKLEIEECEKHREADRKEIEAIRDLVNQQINNNN